MRILIATLVVAVALSGCVERHTFERCRSDDADWDKQEMCHDGRAREWIATVPEGDGPFPLLIALHGGGGDASNMQRKTNLDEWSASHGVIVLYPEGTPGIKGTDIRTFNAAHCCGKADTDATDDVGFLDRLVALAMANENVAANRIGATGHSNGGMMAHHWVASSTAVTHIMPVAGAIGGEAPPGTDARVSPTPKHAPDVLIIHAQDDPRVPYNGGQGENLGLQRVDMSVEDAVDFWVAAGSDVSVVTTTGGHGWPGGEADIPKAPASPDASKLIIEFLLA